MEQRAVRWDYAESPTAEQLAYAHALIEAIRSAVYKRDAAQASEDPQRGVIPAVDTSDDPEGLLHPRIALCDRRTDALIDLPESVAASLLETEPRLRLAYRKYLHISGQAKAPPEQRGRLIVLDQKIVQGVLATLPDEVISTLHAEPFADDEVPDGDQSEEPPPKPDLLLEHHFRQMAGDQFDPDNPPPLLSAVRPTRSSTRQSGRSQNRAR